MWFLLQWAIIVGFTWWISATLYDGHPDRYEGQAIGLFGILIALLVTGYINAVLSRWRAARRDLEEREREVQQGPDF
jgi:peptidoglycan/LPS O-acetylase OafA/YrhL